MSELQSIYLKRPKAHENMPPRTKTVNQEQLRQLRAELRKTKKLVHSERQRSNSAVEHLLQVTLTRTTTHPNPIPNPGPNPNPNPHPYPNLLQLKSSLHSALQQQSTSSGSNGASARGSGPGNVRAGLLGFQDAAATVTP